MKKDEKPDTLAVINNYYFFDRHTHIHTDSQTWRLYERPGPEGRLGEHFRDECTLSPKYFPAHLLSVDSAVDTDLIYPAKDLPSCPTKFTPAGF